MNLIFPVRWHHLQASERVETIGHKQIEESFPKYNGVYLQLRHKECKWWTTSSRGPILLEIVQSMFVVPLLFLFQSVTHNNHRPHSTSRLEVSQVYSTRPNHCVINDEISVRPKAFPWLQPSYIVRVFLIRNETGHVSNLAKNKKISSIWAITVSFLIGKTL